MGSNLTPDRQQPEGASIIASLRQATLPPRIHPSSRRVLSIRPAGLQIKCYGWPHIRRKPDGSGFDGGSGSHVEASDREPRGETR